MYSASIVSGWKSSLSPESAGVVRRLAKGTIEIIVDVGQLFDQWFKVLPTQIQQAQRS